MDSPSAPLRTPFPNPASIFQLPGRTPREILARARALCLSDDSQQFRELLDSAPSETENFYINDFGVIMGQAIQQDTVPIMEELLDREFPMHSVYAWEATRRKSKNALAFLIERGWDINEPMCNTEPSALGPAIHDEPMTI
ncbi:hypothetical protein ASPCADRAFT_6857 [Aspergillus carbonarius ITEM 5010]|uniref:Uncharacterized protein n=1 Tax=Aspergillus carbonarius (strain ITEM 5010) TaxID=602072 RepID=A0A1R3RI68_ASPC5|nr:hypothetical protein ASPCADRAFT_6857 [Aspergillus carbonarius ITEM 5010]